MAFCSTTGAATWPARPAGRAPHRGPLPGRPRRLRRQHRHHAPGHQRHRQGARVGRPRIALSGPGRARLFERDGAGVWPGPSARPAPSPPTSSPSSGSPLRNPVPAAAASKRPSRPPSAPASTWPWWPSLSDGGLRRSEAAVSHLGRRAALGRRQRPHHRGPLQDRRGGPGRRGGHHPRRRWQALWTASGRRGLVVG